MTTNKKPDIILAMIFFLISLFFIIDYIYDNYTTKKAIEAFRNGINKHLNKEGFSNGPLLAENEHNFYKRYIYKQLSADENGNIYKLEINNQPTVIFNNVFSNSNIGEKQTCTILTQKGEMIKGEYEISTLTENELGLKIEWNDETKANTINLTITYDEDNNLISKVNKNGLIIENITEFKNGGKDIDSSNYMFSKIQFSDLIVKKLDNYHKGKSAEIEEKILYPMYEKMNEYNTLKNKFDTLENYYKFKKNMDKNYSRYKFNFE